jgi:26S proteasome regulatory subunit N3
MTTAKEDDSSPVSKLVQAVNRLERMLTTQTVPANTDSHTDAVIQAATTLIHANPSKIVKRWLGTSSGTASSVSLDDVAYVAKTMLDPTGVSANGRDLLMQLSSGMQTTEEESSSTASDPKYITKCTREIESYLLSLAVRILWRQQEASKALELCTKAIQITTVHMEEASKNTYGVGSANGIYPLLARLYRLQSLVAESCKAVFGLEMGQRQHLLNAHRMAVIRRDVDTQATLLNIMLRDLLRSNQVEQAQKLLTNSTFPDSAPNNQLCRHLYYSGRIQALRLEYTSAFSNLSQCLRKAPTNTGLGFRIAVQRLLVVVQLLMGEIPERSVFFAHEMKGELEPYLKITQAVRRGDLVVFHETVNQFSDRLKLDGTYTLISRLAHSVVKAGLRRLNTSYSRISLADIAHRLGLENVTSAEFVVSKAVRDGVIDATIYHKEGYVKSHELVDVYATTEPMDAFHRRIAYCLTTHNDAVRSMRYPPDEYKKQLEASRGMRGKKDEKTDEEKLQEFEEEMDEDY